MVVNSEPTRISAQSPSHPARPLIVGPSSPSPPYPIRLRGKVCKGFGRGGKDLGCPTANLPDDNAGVQAMRGKVDTGVFYGFARVIPPTQLDPDDSDLNSSSNLDPNSSLSPLSPTSYLVYPMVMSLGLNPFYKNSDLTAEIHILHQFDNDFYNFDIKVLVLGYIRPELDYVSREALVQDIDIDKIVARRCLEREAYTAFSRDRFFWE
ncbi:hypothetical protein J3R30DRAFT_1055582 [Lentinula aciculospora]|uniref:Riboflavin kinase n=1 Tax=Lentinula aciculospora TaxID=153920 RepID=A0A9W9DIK2_9AGAR|nr:hypothetical protein J3R30DRAFT_1055582 [Lentinula aciculospora]